MLLFCLAKREEHALEGNVQEGSTVFESLKPVECYFVGAVNPFIWSEKIALTVELYGYEAGKEGLQTT